MDICSVCNKLDIDLYKALKEKEQENVNRTWKKENNQKGEAIYEIPKTFKLSEMNL